MGYSTQKCLGGIIFHCPIKYNARIVFFFFNLCIKFWFIYVIPLNSAKLAVIVSEFGVCTLVIFRMLERTNENLDFSKIWY